MASLVKINNAVTALVQETMHTTLDKLIEFLSDRIELDEDIKGIFDEFRKGMYVPESSGGTKKRRHAPSAYNLYIREKIAELKAAGHKGNMMKMAVEAWKTEKKKS